jgi:hypothetical protein
MTPRRFGPEFQPVFEAWLAPDPFNYPDAAPGPLFMPQYPSSLNAANQHETVADQLFSEGRCRRAISSVGAEHGLPGHGLVPDADGRTFRMAPLRGTILGLAMLMLVFAVSHQAVYPIVP